MFSITNLIFSLLLAQPSQQAIEGKVIHKSCASVVIQVTDSTYYYLTQENWQRTAKSVIYNHVFMVRNSCNFLEQGLNQGDAFRFKIIKNEAGNTGCVQCLMYDNPPNASLSIEVVK